jgi:hypothetical protein
VLPVRHQQAIRALHGLPVILVRSSTNETDLIVLVIVSESWPTKPMGATFSEELLQEGHICPSLRHGQEHSVEIVLKQRVKQCDSLRTHFQITGVHSGCRLPPIRMIQGRSGLRFELEAG